MQFGAWICYRFGPCLAAQGRTPLQIDSPEPSLRVANYVSTENGYNMLKKVHIEAADLLWSKAQQHMRTRWRVLKQQAQIVDTETQPFELGAVVGRKLAATGARDETSHSSGPNLPVSSDREVEKEER